MIGKIQKEDILHFANHFPLSENLKDKVVLITGATGLIGSALIRCLRSIDAKVVGLVRNKAKAIDIFSGEDMNNVTFIENDLANKYSPIVYEDSVDYMIHTACPTSSVFFRDHPTETLDIMYEGTYKVMSFAREKEVKSIVYVSSLESYGSVYDDTDYIREDMQGYINPLDTRSCYSLGKRICECLCKCYTEEYGMQIKIARLTQVFGAGVSISDNRLFAQFARSIIMGKDIVLHTNGESSKPYCYLTDAVCALLFILLKGKNGNAYNVANADTYISIRRLADFLCNEFNPKLKVKICLNEHMGYAPMTKLKLNTDKLQLLGWQPFFDLKTMFERLFYSMKECGEI